MRACRGFCFVEPQAEACQAADSEVLVDQDSERTSSLLTPSRPSSSRRQSRAPRPGMVAGIDELDAMGTLSLRPSQANGLRVEQSSGGGSGRNVGSAGNSADDMTVVAHSGLAGEGADSQVEDARARGRSQFDAPPTETESAKSMVAPAKSKPVVNPKHAQTSGRTEKSQPSRRMQVQGPAAGTRLRLQWALAFAIVFVASWYVLQQPAPQHIERHWVSGRAR